MEAANDSARQSLPAWQHPMLWLQPVLWEDALQCARALAAQAALLEGDRNCICYPCMRGDLSDSIAIQYWDFMGIEEGEGDGREAEGSAKNPGKEAVVRFL